MYPNHAKPLYIRLKSPSIAKERTSLMVIEVSKYKIIEGSKIILNLTFIFLKLFYISKNFYNFIFF